MRAQRRQKNSRRQREKKNLKCLFCEEKKEPDYKEPDLLTKFTASKGKILAGGRSGLCHKHQRRLKIAIKRARFLALLPFARQI